ncbi:hypothetical protein ACN6K5_003531 [Streptomyces violaceoruber]|uniref:hypothetical protein n=1 Tax=Streptomyces violaceoruber TaxID=1935 RepID=UPI00403C9B19
MHRIRPHLRLALSILAGGAIGTGSVLAWQHALASHQMPQWAMFAVSGATALTALGLAAVVQAWVGHRPPQRRAHARPQHLRKAS